MSLSLSLFPRLRQVGFNNIHSVVECFACGLFSKYAQSALTEYENRQIQVFLKYRQE